MRKLTLTLALVASGVFCAVAATGDVEAARAALTARVASIDCDGLPGPLICLDDRAFGVVACRNYDGTRHPVVAAAFAGDGRVVACGHPSFICSPHFLGDTATMLSNTVAWLAHRRDPADVTVGVVRNDGVRKMLAALGVDHRRCDTFAEASKYPVVAFYPDDVPVAEYPAVHDYVRRGGGLLTAALTWGWKYGALRTTGKISPALDYDAERLLAGFGLVAGDLGVNRTGPGNRGFLVSTGLPFGSTLPEAMEVLRRDPLLADDSVRKQVARTLLQTAGCCPPETGGLYSELQRLAGDTAVCKAPSVAAPLKEQDALSRIAIVLRQNEWQAHPERDWPADPAAESYPGLVDPAAGRLDGERRVFDLAVPRWHSTGLFLPAGGRLTVEIPPQFTDLGLSVRVGTTGDDLTPANAWKRAPLVTVTCALDRERTVVSSPFGGLVYLVVPNGKSGTLEASFSGAVAAPHFRRGRDTNATWREMTATARAPQAEIEGRHLIITLGARAAAHVKDPERLVAFWDGALEACARLTGLDRPQNSPERICADVQLTTGWMHDGYPMMYHRSEKGPDWVADIDDIERKGCWGVLHEIGHNHQNRAWTFPGTGEVTVNLFTLYCTETLLGIDARAAYPGHTDRESCMRRVRKWMDADRTFEGWKSDYFLALETFTRIKEVYGWDLFLKMFREYRAPMVGKYPRGDQERIDQWAERLSRLTGHDFAEYFRAWSWPISEATAKACAHYIHAPDARLWAGLTAVPEDAVVPLAIEPVDGGIGNVANWTSLRARVEPEARAHQLVAGLRCNPSWRLAVRLHDETVGREWKFEHQVGDMRKDIDAIWTLPLPPHGIVPEVGHRYTVGFEVHDGERLRYRGISAAGAFTVDGCDDFIDYGVLDAAPSIRPLDRSPLVGRRALFAGDSICEAICEVHVPALNYTAGWAGRIGWKHRLRWMNRGRSGATFSNVWGGGNTIRRQLDGLEGHTFDLILANGGINDGMGRAPAGKIAPGSPEEYNGEAETFATFAGSLEHFFWTCRRRFPEAKVGYIITYRVPPKVWDDCGTEFEKFIPLAKRICEKWGVPYVDLWNNAEITAQTRPGERLAFGDGLHANDLGYDIITPYIEAFALALAEGRAAPGREFGVSLAPYRDRYANAIGPDDVNLALGKPAYCPKGGWRTDLTDGSLEGKGRLGGTTRREDLRLSKCYATVDLGDLYAIDKVRAVMGINNGVSQWAVYATDDDTKPLSDWRCLTNEPSTRMNTSAGKSVAFDAIDAKYVRFYAWTERTPGYMGFVEVEVYGEKSPRATDATRFFRKDRPLPAPAPKTWPAVDPELGENIARGCPASRPDGTSYPTATDGVRAYALRWRGILNGAKGETDDDNGAYLTVDLGEVCEVSAVRWTDGDTVPNYFEVYGALDDSLPIAQWQRIGEKRDGRIAGEEGFTVKPAVPVRSRYVRVYAVRRNVGFGEIEVYGRRTGAVAPTAAHHYGRTRQFDASGHWFACTDAGCRAERLHAEHRLQPELLESLPEGTRPGVLATPCADCGFRLRRQVKGPAGLGRLVSRGASVRAGTGAKRTYAERLTDGDFVASARLGVADEANPSVASDRYYEIDLGAERNVRFVNLLGQAGRRTSWRIYVSPDGDERQWRLWGDFRAQAAEGLSGVWLEGAPQPARFVRIYGMGGDYDASHAGAVVREVTLYE